MLCGIAWLACDQMHWQQAFSQLQQLASKRLVHDNEGSVPMNHCQMIYLIQSMTERLRYAGRTTTVLEKYHNAPCVVQTRPDLAANVHQYPSFVSVAHFPARNV